MTIAIVGRRSGPHQEIANGGHRQESTMLTHLRLERFKNFQEADLSLGPLTLLVGANASGKSNLRDAFRFLHGISRRYTLAEIMGQKYGEGGEPQWRGIRGGTREATYQGSPTFTLEIALEIHDEDTLFHPLTYRIEVEPGSVNGPRVVAERLYVAQAMLFDSDPPDNPPPPTDPQHLVVRIRPGGRYRKGHVETFISNRPVLAQMMDRIVDRVRNPKDEGAKQVWRSVRGALEVLGSMRFLDLSPEAMRLPSLPGQVILGDRGENLSSVLQAICSEPARKEALIQWVQELTPMDAADFDFPADQIGRVLVTLTEEGGQRTSAYSASDGTLRFLAMIAALLGPEPAQFYFFEELENGIHPARLHLLLELIEQEVSGGVIQMLATTHSPQLLGLLSPAAREHASLIYRLERAPDARVKRILDIPEARRVLEKQDLSQLHAYGWLEDAVSFVEGQATAA